MSKEKSNHKYGYKFGKTDRGILLSIMMASLFLVAVAGCAALATAGLALEGDTSDKADGTAVSPVFGALGTGAVALGVAIVLISPCFEVVLILIVITIISYIIYRLVSWLEERCSSCDCCRWPRCWACCAGKLFCWMITVTKWVALVVTVILAIVTFITLIVCIGTTMVGIF